MSTQKLTLKNEAATQSSDQIMVLSARPSNDTIYPNEIVLPNEARAYFSGTTGLGVAGYIYMSGDNDFVVGNFSNGKKILILTRATDGTQREITITTDDTTLTPKIAGQDGLQLIASGSSADILLDASGDIKLDANGAIMMIGLPTSDPHVVGQLWNSSATLKISAG